MLIDSNILIYSLNSDSPKNQAAQDFLQSQKKLIFAQQNILESLRILTHPNFPKPFSTKLAIKAIREITDQAKIISPTWETLDLALELIGKYRVSGAETFDAYLVATAITNHITEIATDNIRHLRRYSEIQVSNPF